ncbi:MAG: riboflavin synthase [Sphingobacteriales bacterium]|nr:MAG: riboflavin synthase [Sphingobacteriales bacterium]
MFTGIIESLATIENVERSGGNAVFWLSSPISDEFMIDQSVSHNGVCLTIDALEPGRHRVTAVAETLARTDLETWSSGAIVNLERSMKMNGRLDGHIVQGHVDATGTIISVADQDGSWAYRVAFPQAFASLVIEKGSICLNGISLTVFDISSDAFSVAIIPYTYNHTNLRFLGAGSKLNLEFDMVGKYINRIHQLNRPV